MKILVACEESQAITIELRKLDHEAYSCDVDDCSGGYPEWHIKNDCKNVIKAGDWDMIIMHPPCTALAVSGNRWYGKNMPKNHERRESIEWTKDLWNLACSVCDKVALENPVSVIFSELEGGKLQYIQPWQFGHGETKKTGFYTKGLPELLPTSIVDGREQKVWKMPPSEDRARLRSKTYPGVAKAIANQWAGKC